MLTIKILTELDNNIFEEQHIPIKGNFLKKDDLFQIKELCFTDNGDVRFLTSIGKYIGLAQFRVNQNAWEAYLANPDTWFTVLDIKRKGHDIRGTRYYIVPL